MIDNIKWKNFLDGLNVRRYIKLSSFFVPIVFKFLKFFFFFKGPVEEIGLDSLRSKCYPENTQLLFYQDLIKNTPENNHRVLNNRFTPFPGFRFKDRRVGSMNICSLLIYTIYSWYNLL